MDTPQYAHTSRIRSKCMGRVRVWSDCRSISCALGSCLWNLGTWHISSITCDTAEELLSNEGFRRLQAGMMTGTGKPAVSRLHHELWIAQAFNLRLRVFRTPSLAALISIALSLSLATALHSSSCLACSSASTAAPSPATRTRHSGARRGKGVPSDSCIPCPSQWCLLSPNWKEETQTNPESALR